MGAILAPTQASGLGKGQLAEPLDASQAQRERLAFLELRAFFTGELRRSDIESRFGIKPAASSRDLALYREIAPENLEYDTASRCYRPAESFQPVFEFNPDRVLAWLPSGMPMLLTWFASTYLGAVFVPLNPAYRGRILEHVINNAASAVMVAHHELVPRLHGLEVLLVQEQQHEVAQTVLVLRTQPADRRNTGDRRGPEPVFHRLPAQDAPPAPILPPLLDARRACSSGRDARRDAA